MNILTIDIEEYFHLLQHDSLITDFNKFESRIDYGVNILLDILEQTNTKATFFCLGWIAEKYPELIKKISQKYDIGTHSYNHKLIFEQNKKSFKEDLDASINILEDTIGRKVIHYRAPGFSLRESEKWIFELLYEKGITTDSSIFPYSRNIGGFPKVAVNSPFIIEYNGVTLKEFPISSTKFLFQKIVFSGGGYFRILPYFIIKTLTGLNNYNMSYLHPRDFDKYQPKIEGLPLIRKFKSCIGVKGSERKMIKWLNDFNFIDIGMADKIIDWEKVPKVIL